MWPLCISICGYFMVTLTSTGYLLQRRNIQVFINLFYTNLTFYASAVVGYSNFHTWLSSICEINVSYDYFWDWKIANFEILIMMKHVDRAPWKFMGKELRIHSSTPVTFMAE